MLNIKLNPFQYSKKYGNLSYDGAKYDTNIQCVYHEISSDSNMFVVII